MVTVVLTFTVPSMVDQKKIIWPLIALHVVTGLIIALSYWIRLTSTIRTIGLTLIIPVYLVTLSYYLPDIMTILYKLQ